MRYSVSGFFAGFFVFGLFFSGIKEPAVHANQQLVGGGDPVADSLILAIEKRRAETEEWLKSGATSYLATIMRKDFGDRASMTIGRGDMNVVKIKDRSVAERHLKVTVVGDSFLVQSIDRSASFLYGGGFQERGSDRTRLREDRSISHSSFPPAISCYYRI